MEVKMKRVSSYFITFMLVLLFAGCSSGAQEKHSIALGETIEIELESNWSTGYRWYLTTEDDLKYISKSNFDYGSDLAEENDELSGAPGLERWSFTGESRGTEALKFEYRRAPDEKKPEQRMTIKITVE